SLPAGVGDRVALKQDRVARLDERFMVLAVGLRLGSKNAAHRTHCRNTSGTQSDSRVDKLATARLQLFGVILSSHRKNSGAITNRKTAPPLKQPETSRTSRPSTVARSARRTPEQSPNWS